MITAISATSESLPLPVEMLYAASPAPIASPAVPEHEREIKPFSARELYPKPSNSNSPCSKAFVR
jgi:hypothetical protein